MTRPRIYLAGPDVFLSDVARIRADKEAVCRAAGLEPVWPFDGEADLSIKDPQGAASSIGGFNLDAVAACDGLIANASPFRGVSADAGTLIEITFAVGLGRKVAAYTNDGRDYLERSFMYHNMALEPFRNEQLKRDYRLMPRDQLGMMIENLDQPDNLMLPALLRRNGTELVVRHKPCGLPRYTDLEAFKVCVRELVGRFENASAGA